MNSFHHDRSFDPVFGGSFETSSKELPKFRQALLKSIEGSILILESTLIDLQMGLRAVGERLDSKLK